MKVNVIEPFCIGKEHLINNITFLKSLLDDKSVIGINFYADKKHGIEVLTLLRMTPEQEKKVNFIPIKVVRDNFFKRVFNEVITISRIFITSNKSSVFLFLSVNETSQVVIKLLNIICGKKIVLIPHAILTTLNRNSCSGRYSWLKKMLCFELWLKILNSKKIKYLILGKHIEVRMNELNKLHGVNYSVIPLPYLYDEKHRNIRHCSEELIVSFIGIGSKDKNIEKFYQLVNKYKGTIKFKHLGVLAEDVKYLPEKYGFNISNDKMIAFDLLQSEIVKSDYIYMNLEKESYALRASATFFDCINLGKPMIIEKDSFYYENEIITVINNVGISYDAQVDLYESLKRVSSEEYEGFQENIYEIKRQISNFDYGEAVLND
ncbi:hypothetical protein PVK63_09350 [Aliivibrio sp. S2TY2]|uniref:hypothetical protein n=1 Tax=unclassified Aliivibrio TaxID=2645654 RepID=UPI0023794819|nr:MULTISPECIES: hypothetical protein [unclassified Aliivibrio]MDD9174897.1 hypothetical protein [Aliivibrio sp. S3TY1]MDD9192156.1 hypothetical protein [Aliivibrio sp. S2TY2]